VSESVDLGQFVTTGRALATVYGTDTVEVRVPLESKELAWFTVPTRTGDRGPRAEVNSSFGGQRHTWEGRVVRMEAQLDATSRMAHVVIEVRRPFNPQGDRPPLMPNTFVDVRIFGRSLDGVVPLPRHALRDGEKVWVFDDGSLRILDVRVARADRERVYVSAGLVEGDEVIISALDAVTDGMKVRAAGSERSESPTGGGK